MRDSCAWRVFAVLALVFGTAFALSSPPLTAPDEGRHFARIHLGAQGHLRIPSPKTGPTIPRSAVRLFQEVNTLWPARQDGLRTSPDVLWRLLHRPLAPEERAPVQNLPNYGPVAYAPQIAGVALGRLFGASPGVLVLLGRIANLLAWVAVVGLAIRITPIRRWAFCLFGLLPMQVYLAGTLSADALTSGLALLLMAGLLRVGIEETQGATLRNAGWLCAVAALLGLTKVGYVALVAVALILPASRLGGTRRQLALFAGLAVCALIPALLWSSHTRDFAFPGPESAIDAGAQLSGILRDPAAFIGVFFGSLFRDGGAWIASFLGVLGRLDVVLPAVAYPVAALAPMAAAWLGGDDPASLGLRRRIALVILGAGIAMAIVASAYLMWNPVGAASIRGVQGRYFLPIAPLLLVALPTRRSRTGIRVPPVGWAAVGGLVLGVGVIVNFLRYFRL